MFAGTTHTLAKIFGVACECKIFWTRMEGPLLQLTQIIAREEFEDHHCLHTSKLGEIWESDVRMKLWSDLGEWCTHDIMIMEFRYNIWDKI
jgi:hypothetical protein